MSDRLIELRVKNRQLQEEVENLERKILSLVGNIEIHSSGGPNQKDFINEKIIEIINNTNSQLNIISPKIDKFYANEIKKLVKKGVPVLLITNDRRGLLGEYLEIFEDLKQTEGVNIISNPNIRLLLVFNTEEAVYSGGSLDRKELAKSVLIVTVMRERSRLKSLAEIVSLMLPSFMRR